MTNKEWATKIQDTQDKLNEHPLCPSQPVYVPDLPNEFRTALRSHPPKIRQGHRVGLEQGEKGVILTVEAFDDWQGYWVMFEKTGLVWVEWYKVRPQ